MKQCFERPTTWKRNFPLELIRISFFILALGFLFGSTASAKQFLDSLATDFYAGKADNLNIRQDLHGTLELAPYAMLGTWTTTKAPSSSSLYLASVVTYNGKIYISGGFGNNNSSSSGGPVLDNALNKVWYSTVMADGSIGDDWKQDDASALPQPTYGHASAVVNGRLYIIGGRTTANTTLSTVYYAKIMGWDGSLKALYTPNTWTAVAPLPKALFRTQAVVHEGRIYVMGGQDNFNAATNYVYYAPVRPDGSINGWTLATAQLPTNLSGHSAVISNGRIYVLGGSSTGESLDVTANVYIGQIDPASGDITSWTQTTPLPEALAGAAATVSSGKIWVSGGINSATARTSVYYARINPGGGIPLTTQPDTWTRTTDLPVPIYNHMMVDFNGHLYIVGGTNNAGSNNQVYTSTLVSIKSVIAHWVPTTPLFLSSYGGGIRPIWTGHTAQLRVPLSSATGGSQNTAPTIFVIGGGPNTYSAWADGLNSTTAPGAYATVYNAQINSNGGINTWSAPDTGGSMPCASLLHASTMVALTQGNSIYVVGGANSTNAFIWAGAASRSLTAVFQTDGAGWPLQVGQTTVFFEKVGQASSSGGSGELDLTSPIPIFDPVFDKYSPSFTQAPATIGGFMPNTATPIYQPLIRARTVSSNGVIYVMGGISRANDWTGVNGEPAGSHPVYERRVWYAIPNPGGPIAGGDGSTNNAGAWMQAPDLPAPRYDAAAVVAYNRIYVIGGRDDTLTPTNTIFIANINRDGTISPWITSPVGLPAGVALAEHEVVFTSGRFYVIGGTDATPGGGVLQHTIYYCTPNPYDGHIPDPATNEPGSWWFSNTALEYPVAGHSAVANNGYIYVIGGRYNTADQNTSSTYMININDMDTSHVQDIYYSWDGSYERYVDLGSDQLVQDLNWTGDPNSETVEVKCRYALEKGPWSDWTPIQAQGPFVINLMARYLHYKVHMSTLDNQANNLFRTPSITQVYIDYAASKPMQEDDFIINHNVFDPQTTTLLVSFKTRVSDVANAIIRVYNTEGELIRKQNFDIPASIPLPATFSWTWDGTNENNELVANGVYIIQYNSGDTHKLRKVLVVKR